MTKFIGIISIERELESGISAELKTFFSDSKEEIRSWQKMYEDKFEKDKKEFPYSNHPTLRTEMMVNSREANELFRPYYDYLALPLELRQRPGSDAKNEIERLRHDLS